MSGWGRYRKKPVVIEAMQLVGTNADTHAVYQWIEANTQGSFDPLSEEIPASGVSIDPATGFFLIATLEGVMQAKPGDWIIRGVQGEFYPCKPDIFAATYEPARLARRIERSGRVARLRGRHAAMGVHRVGLRLRVGVRAQHLAHASEESGVGRVTTPTLA